MLQAYVCIIKSRGRIAKSIYKEALREQARRRASNLEKGAKACPGEGLRGTINRCKMKNFINTISNEFRQGFRVFISQLEQEICNLFCNNKCMCCCGC